MIYWSIRVHTGPYGAIFVARGEKSQVEKVKIHISDRDFFLGLVQGDVHLAGTVVLTVVQSWCLKNIKQYKNM